VDTSIAGMMLRLVLALVVVLGLLGGFAWLARKRPGALGGLRKAGPIDVVARQQLSRTSSVQIVRLGDRAVVLGVTDSQVTYLTEGDLSDIADYVDLTRRPSAATVPGAEWTGSQKAESTAKPSPSNSSRMGLLEALREKSTRR
jgi:flagellar protein FliO/FliZ